MLKFEAFQNVSFDLRFENTFGIYFSVFRKEVNELLVKFLYLSGNPVRRAGGSARVVVSGWLGAMGAPISRYFVPLATSVPKHRVLDDP